ncbi:MAG: undecaprenyl-diphosphate phosphatase [Bacilli bacterium]
MAVIYWQYLLKMLAGLLGRNPEGLRLLRNLIAAFLPAAVVGLILHDFIESQLFGVKPVIFALAAGAVLMLAMQKYYDKRQYSGKRYPKLEDMKLSKAFLMSPSMRRDVARNKRSMMTILAGISRG